MGCCCCRGWFERRRLQRLEYDDAPRYVPNLSYAKVVSVYDGDTITVISRPDMKGQFYKYRVRLARIDAPELNAASSKQRKKAAEARDFLAGLIMDKVVLLKDVKIEKYGRVLADVEYDGRLVSDTMINNDHAVSYP